MKLNYDRTERKFDEYIKKCREQIRNTFFSDEELENSISLKSQMVSSGEIKPSTTVSDAIKKHRNQMIDIKLNHTMRVVNDVGRMSEKLGTPVDFNKVLKVSALLHDYARFKQAIWNDSFNDKNCKEFNGMYHAEFGYHLLYVNNKFEKFNVPQKYKFAISQVVKYHQVPTVTGALALTFSNVNELDVKKYLTGNEELTNEEKVIVAALVQMVKDVDMLDILYQHLTGEFPVTRSSITYDVNNDTLDEISKHFGISKEEIKTFNGLKSDDLSDKKSIFVPVANVNPIKLQVPQDIQNRFFDNENLDLRELQNRQDWTFITGMWWRLNHFLNNINFVSNLEVVEENKLLEQIYATYPDKYKPLVYDAFAFAKEILLEQAIKKNNGEIYKTK